MYTTRLFCGFLILNLALHPVTLKDNAAAQPGDISPNAKSIDADHLYPFNMGAAVITKGSSSGLIDPQGNFILPYNKYNILGYDTRTQNGIFLLSGGQGAVNAKGKLITEKFPGLSWDYERGNGKYIYGSNQNNLIFLDANGQSYTIKQTGTLSIIETRVDEETIVVLDRSSYKSGYKNLKDEWIIKPSFDQAEPFSEGLACVGKKNEFGEMKYGFVDKTGKEAIGFVFSRKPDNFHGGLARVTPKDMTEFKEAYIDRKGKVIHKLQNVGRFSYVANGIYLQTLNGFNVLDSTGIIQPGNDFLKSYNVTLDPTDKAFSLSQSKVVQLSDGKIYYFRNKKSNPGNCGFIDIKTRKVVEGPFQMSGNLHFHDRVSGLALAEFYPNPGPNYRSTVRKGYINEDGVFTILQGEASKW